jgi:hypothetical protein
VHVVAARSEADLSFANAKPLPDDEMDAAAQTLRAGLVATDQGVHVPVSVDSPRL